MESFANAEVREVGLWGWKNRQRDVTSEGLTPPLLALKVEKAGHELENEGQPLRAKKSEADTLPWSLRTRTQCC